MNLDLIKEKKKIVRTRESFSNDLAYEDTIFHYRGN